MVFLTQRLNAYIEPGLIGHVVTNSIFMDSLNKC